MLTIPIKADCKVPKVTVSPADGFLDFGKVFLKDPVTLDLEITNDDILKAKNEIVPQDE